MNTLIRRVALICTILAVVAAGSACSSDDQRLVSDDADSTSTADDADSVDDTADNDVFTDAPDETTDGDSDGMLSTDASSQDGENALPFDELAYAAPPRCDNISCDSDDCRPVVDVCWITSQDTDFVGIVEVLEVGDLQEVNYCGEDVYASNYIEVRVGVRQTVFEQDGGTNDTVDAVFLTQGMRSFHFEPGDLLLVGMRPARGTWFGLGYVYVLDGRSNETEDSCLYRIRLPENVSDLVRASKNARSDYENECPDYAPYTKTDEQFESWTHAPMCQ